MTQSKTAPGWAWLDGNESERGRWLQQLGVFLRDHPERDLDHLPDWLCSKAQANQGSCRLCLYRNRAGRLAGYAPFFVHPGQFEFGYAGRTLARYSNQRYALTGRVLLDPDVDDGGTVVRQLLQFLRSQLGGREVIFFLGLQLDSVLGRLLASGQVNDQFLVMRHGPAYQRRLARLPDSLEAYLAALGRKTRQDLRRQERRLLKEADDAVSLSTYTTPTEVRPFLAAVERVSRLTYQWSLLGIGIRQQESTVAMLTQAAEQGRLRGYILSVRDEPIAFMIGYLDGGTYYSESIGYHPDWAGFSAGNVLHLYVVSDLAELDSGVEWFDFLYGDNSNKARLSTDHREEQNVYLIPKTVRWRLVIAALRAFNALTDRLSSLLDRWGLKDRIRRAMRSRAVRAARSKDS